MTYKLRPKIPALHTVLQNTLSWLNCMLDARHSSVRSGILVTISEFQYFVHRTLQPQHLLVSYCFDVVYLIFYCRYGMKYQIIWYGTIMTNDIFISAIENVNKSGVTTSWRCCIIFYGFSMSVSVALSIKTGLTYLLVMIEPVFMETDKSNHRLHLTTLTGLKARQLLSYLLRLFTGGYKGMEQLCYL